MNAKAEEQVTFADKLVTVIAVAIVSAGVAAYYYFADQSVLVRAPMVLAGIAVGLFVFYQSGLGQARLALYQGFAYGNSQGRLADPPRGVPDHARRDRFHADSRYLFLACGHGSADRNFRTIV